MYFIKCCPDTSRIFHEHLTLLLSQVIPCIVIFIIIFIIMSVITTIVDTLLSTIFIFIIFNPPKAWWFIVHVIVGGVVIGICSINHCCRGKRSEESFCRELQRVVEASDAVDLVECVCKSMQPGSLLVIRGCVVANKG